LQSCACNWSMFYMCTCSGSPYSVMHSSSKMVTDLLILTFYLGEQWPLKDVTSILRRNTFIMHLLIVWGRVLGERKLPMHVGTRTNFAIIGQMFYPLSHQPHYPNLSLAHVNEQIAHCVHKSLVCSCRIVSPLGATPCEFRIQ